MESSKNPQNTLKSTAVNDIIALMRDTRHIYRDKHGRLIAAIHPNGKQHLKECADKDGWPRTPDCFRHSFATYLFGLTNDSARAAAICGHEESVA